MIPRSVFSDERFFVMDKFFRQLSTDISNQDLIRKIRSPSPRGPESRADVSERPPADERDAPHRIKLVDYEDDGHPPEVVSVKERLAAIEVSHARSRSTSPSLNENRDGSRDAKNPFAAISNGKDIQRFAENSFLATQNNARILFRSVSQNADKARSNVSDAFEKSGAAKALNQVGESVQYGFKETKDFIDRTGIPRPFIKTGEDISDVKNKTLGGEGLCSRCEALPLSACFTDPSQNKSEELEWNTPLSRAIYHADWCRMCRLLLSMLCRPQHDPLRHPGVAPHLQPEVQGLSMKQWVSHGWKFTDENWPFGRGEHRHEGATQVFGPIGERFGRILEDPAGLVHAAVAVGKIVVVANGGRTRRTERSKKSYYDKGVREGKMALTRHPMSCVIVVNVSTSKAAYPGVLTVTLVGHGNRPGGEAQVLSHFLLRVVSSGVEQNFDAEKPLRYWRLLDKNWSDISLTQRWLLECEAKHGTRCSQHGWHMAMEQPRFLRVIDVESMCLVEPANLSSCRYIALSYVWGKSKTVMLRHENIVKLSRRGGLNDFLPRLPRTVVDAMEVVRSVGERYLWVDSLCILQEQTDEAHEQIATMDRVYGSALFTIVAAHGDNADVGLPGVRRTYFPAARETPRNIDQPQAKHKDNTHILAPFDCKQHLDITTWSTRAWTFQEKLLSRRLLVFCEDEVVWHCRSMTFREDMEVGGQDLVRCDSLEWLQLKPQYFEIDQHWIDGSIERDRFGSTHLVRSGTFSEYAKMIENYTIRNLTNHADIIKALEGLLHIFQRSFQSEFIFGLPKVLLDTALLWRPMHPLSRRPPSSDGTIFPTWSWAGWQGQVTYEKPLSITRNADGKITRAERAFSGEEGIRPLVRWFTLNPKIGKLGAVNGSGRGIPIDGRDFPPEWENLPFPMDKNDEYRPRKTDLQPAMKKEVGREHLVFYTSYVSSFQLGKGPGYEQIDRLNPVTDTPGTASRSGPLRYQLVDANFEYIGTVLMDGDSPDVLDSSKHDFILLAEARAWGMKDERLDGNESWKYLVMLVEKDRGTGICRRLGLGRVYKSAWMLAEPKLRVVVLG